MFTEVASGKPWTRIDYRTLQRIVTDHLRSAIFAGQLQPGQQLHQATVAKHLGVSRMPVREAMRVLHSEGLVLLHPHQTATVVNLCPDDIIEIFEIRAILEAKAAEVAASRLSDATITRLRQIIAEMGGSTRDLEQWLSLNDDFHNTIYPACGWPRLCALIIAQRNIVKPYLRAGLSVPGRADSAHEEHHQILRAAEAGDGKRLSELTVAHLRSTGRLLVEYLSTTTLAFSTRLTDEGRLTAPGAKSTDGEQATASLQEVGF